jgi:hypothetical protein
MIDTYILDASVAACTDSNGGGVVALTGNSSCVFIFVIMFILLFLLIKLLVINYFMMIVHYQS